MTTFTLRYCILSLPKRAKNPECTTCAAVLKPTVFMCFQADYVSNIAFPGACEAINFKLIRCKRFQNVQVCT